jgi:hypothetical protein
MVGKLVVKWVDLTAGSKVDSMADKKAERLVEN